MKLLLLQSNNRNSSSIPTWGEGGFFLPVTYGNISQGQFDVPSILDTLNQVLDHIVTEREGKSLQGERIRRFGRALQVEAGVGYAQDHGCR